MSLTSTSGDSRASDAIAASPLCTNCEAKPSAAKTSHNKSQVTGSSSTTISRGASGDIAYLLGQRLCYRQRQCQTEGHAGPTIFNYFDLTAMFIGDFASNRQTETTARSFRGPHWFKEVSNGRIIDAGAAVTKEDLGAAHLSIESGFDFNTATVGHCINAVVGKIEKQLQEAIVIAPERRQGTIEIGLGVDP